jgi:integrase
MGRIFKRGETWWIAYSYRGKEYRESTRSNERTDATALLKKRLGEVGLGKPAGNAEERVTFDELAKDFIRDYEIMGKRSIAFARERVGVLRRHFEQVAPVDVTAARLREFVQTRLSEGVAPATVNRDLAALRRMFTLAVQAGRLSKRPHFPRLAESQPRQGFFEHAQYLAVRARLSGVYGDLLDFGYHSGWRRGEIEALEWRDVDRSAGVIRLRPELSKSKEGRTLVLSQPLEAVIAQRWQARALGCPFVFHLGGQRVGCWRRRWMTACKAAGVPGRLFHDLRRTVVRNLVRAGVPERIAMGVTGHKTRSVFMRYDIVNEADLRQASERLADYVAFQASGEGVLEANSDNSRTIRAVAGRGPRLT